MKVTKRILVAMLALALLVASFAFMASAEQEKPFSTEGINEIEDILEFHECKVYVNNDLNSYDDSNVAALEGTVDEVEATVKIPGDASAGYHTNLSKPESKMVFEFKVYMGEDTVGNLVFDLKALLSKETVQDSSFTSLLQIDMLSKTPAFKYSVWNETEKAFEADTVALDGVVPKVKTWYSIVLLFNADDGTYSFSITPEGGQKVDSPAISLGDKTAMDFFRLVGEFRNYTPEALDKSASFKTKDVEVYAGSFVRDIDKKEEITATTLTELAALYESAKNAGGAEDIAICIRIAEVYKALGADVLGDAIEDTETIYNYAYAEALVLAVGAIDAGDTYLGRREAVAKIDYYNTFLPSNDELFPEGEYATTVGIDAKLAAEVKAARALLETERVTLDAIQENSIKFVEILLGNAVEIPEEGEPVEIPAYDSTWVNFDEVIVPYYNKILKLFEKKSEQPDLTYSDENVDMADVLESWNDLENKIKFVNDKTAEFKKLVDILKKTSNKFGVRYYDGYLPAKAFLEEIKEDSYYAIISTSAAFKNQVTAYEADAPKMQKEEQNCQEFIKIVEEASLATYYTVLVERLDSAAKYLDKVKDDYKGVTEAKATYKTLRDATLKDNDNAVAYIEKVQAAVETFASDKATFADKQAAVDAATALKALGNIYGYAGVSEANIELSKMESALAFAEGSSITLISLVNQLSDAKTISERRAIIRLAKEAAQNSENTYEGVAAAKTALDAAVTEFNKVVEAANTALADATVNAASVAAGLSGAASVYKTASIIKDYAK